MRALYWVLTGAVAIALTVFSVSNRQSVSLGFWPFGYALDAPLYLVTLASLLIGLVIGAGSAWIGGYRRRRQAREARRRLAAVERELAAAQARLDQAGASEAG